MTKKNEGKMFEEDILKSVEGLIYHRRLRDTVGYAKVVNEGDFIFYMYPLIYLLELKSIKGKRLPLQNINPIQLKLMYRIGRRRGMITGYVLNFREVEKVYYVDIDLIADFFGKSRRGEISDKSISVDWARENGIEIIGHKKRTRYTYELLEFFLDMKGRAIDGGRTEIIESESSAEGN